MLNLYAGFDVREEIGYHTFCSSVIHHASIPVSICPLDLRMLDQVYDGGSRDGTNAFIYSRFLVPYLQGFRGMAVFADGCDMILKADIAQLEALYSPFKAVQVVKHEYRTQHDRKYVGTDMEADNHDYPRKNWSSLMLINCAHFSWRDITPEAVANLSGSMLHRFDFIPERFIGDLPTEWNWLADEYGENESAKLLHWTAGIPGFEHYANAPHARDWHAAAAQVRRHTL